MKSLRMGIVDVTLVAGAGTGSWGDPDLINGTPAAIVLEYVPDVYWCACKTNGGTAAGTPQMVVTASGVTLTGGGSDTGTYRCYGVCRADDLGI